MAKYTAYVTGLILSVMVFFNGQLSEYTNAYVSNVFYHGIGLLVFGIIVILNMKNAPKSPFKWVYLIPGVLGSIAIILNNVVVSSLGITLMIAFTLLGQVITSLVIDQLGLLGKPRVPSNSKQWLGISFMLVGLIIMVF